MKVKPPPIFMNLSKDIKPVTTKSRRHTQNDQKFLSEETARLLREGIIEPSVSPW